MGYSTHNGEQLTRGAAEPVEYLSIGPIFPTESKLKPDPVVGLERLRELRELTTKPLAAIGGITLDNALQIFDAKADSVAVISGILPEKCNRKNAAKPRGRVAAALGASPTPNARRWLDSGARRAGQACKRPRGRSQPSRRRSAQHRRIHRAQTEQSTFN